jgi:hypothetical protein
MRSKLKTGKNFQPQRLKFFEEKFVAADAEIFNNIGDDAARDVARVPGECDEAVGMKRIGIMPMAAGGAEEFAADFTQATVKLAAIPRRIFAHDSSGEDELVTKRCWNGAPGFKQRFQMGFGGQLETERGLTAITSMRMTAR